MKNNLPNIRKVCVYGVGGVGGYFGGKIANTINKNNEMNHEIYFIARGEHLNIIKRDGITVVTPEKTIIGMPAIATSDIHEIPDPDLFLMCVKSYDLDEVVKAIIPKVDENTIVMPLLNGADIYDRTRKNLDNGIVLPACVFVGTHIERPGVINQNGGDGIILFGKDPRFPNFSPDNVIKIFEDMGIKFKWNEDPFPGIWGKYIFIAAFGLITVYTGKTLGEIMEDEESKELVRRVMTEISSIAKKMGIGLSENIIEESISKAKNFPYETKTSYQRDVETKGNVSEGDLYGGTIISSGEALGVPTPVTRTIYSEIKKRLSG
jgi:2-dehydropantoate 2-reductase